MKLQFYALVTMVMIYHAGFSQDLGWAKRIGGTADEGFNKMTVDKSGNTFMTGGFWGTVDFDPGPATFYLTAQGERDVFISKMDSAGNLVWAKAIGGPDYDGGNAIAVDAEGNVYVSGHFEGTVDFDPGPGSFNLTGYVAYGSSFISKFNSDGNFLWAKLLTGPGHCGVADIFADAAGNLYFTGSLLQTIDFDPGPGEFLMQGSIDIFILKLDNSGNFKWAKQMGGPWSLGIGRSIAVDGAGFCYVIGSFEGVIDFNPGPGVFHLSDSAFTTDAFIVRIDSSGNFTWAKQIGGTGLDLGLSISVDQAGSVYATGVFQETVNFKRGSGVYNMTAELVDMFICRLDAGGNLIWVKQIGGNSFVYPYSLALDAAGNVYTTGEFVGTSDFDPGAGTYLLTSSTQIPDYSIFISKLNTQGDFLWAKTFDGSASASGQYIGLDMPGNVFISGEFRETVDFDPGVGALHLTSAGERDLFFLKIIQCRQQPNLSVSAASNFIYQGGSTQLHASGADNYTWSPAAGLSATTGASVTASPLVTTIYTVTGSTAMGCSQQQSITLKVEPPGNFIESFSVSPNPGRGLFTVNLTLHEMKNVLFVAYDGIGKMVYKSTPVYVNGNYQYVVDLSRHAAGVYYLQAIIGNKVLIEKLLIQR